MKKLKIVGIVMFSLVFVSLIIIAMPLAGVGSVDVASASSDDGSGIQEEYYAKTIEWFEQTTSGTMDFFEYEEESLNEIIKSPDEMTKMLEEISEPYEEIEGKVKASPTEVAIWLTALSTKKLVKPYLVYVDTDGDGKPEELAALYNYPYKESLAFEDFSSIGGHYKLVPSGHVPDPYGDFGFVINPFEMPEKNLGNICELVYIKNPDEISIIPKKTITIDEVIGKTPAEIGLDKDDRGLFGKMPNQTSSPTQSAPPSGIPTGKEEGIPGFELIFAIIGLLAMAYVLRRRDK